MLPPATAGSLKAFAQFALSQAVCKTLPEKQEVDRCFADYTDSIRTRNLLAREVVTTFFLDPVESM
jgi:hypothetical protein